MRLVRFRYLQENGIFRDRTAVSRAIKNYGFPKPLQLGVQAIAWRLSDVEAWLKSRPRPAPGEKKRGRPALPSVMEARDSP